MKDLDNLSLETLCVKDSAVTESGQSHVQPIHATSAYTYKNIEDSIAVFNGDKEGYVYSRYANPTIETVENKLAKLESMNTNLDATCIMTSSGLSAISTFVLSQLESGDAVLTQNDLYGGTTEIFKKIISKYGIVTYAIDLSDSVLVEATLKRYPAIKLVYCETPSNPTLNCLEIEKLAKLSHEYEAICAIDNTFSTFYLQQPFRHGVDFVLYSATKFLNGHGNSIAGAIIARDKSQRKQIWDTMKLLGTNSNPWDAWLLHNGLKTLSVRMDRHCSNAHKIAQYLEAHQKVNRVNYPGLQSHPAHKHAQKQMSQYGGMLSFEIDGGLEEGKAFMNNTQLCSITATLGNVDTLLLHPATSSHLNIPKDVRVASGITDGLVRMSVGIEQVDDLIADISQSLSALS